MEESIVKLRKKVLKNGKSSLYLDFYVNGKREYEFLKIYISNEPKDKSERDDNKRNLAIARQIRNNREQEIYSGMYGVATNYNTDASFIEFFEDLTVNMNTSDKIKIFKWGEMFLIAKYNEIENEKITWEFIESSMPIESLYMYYELTENEEKTRVRFTHFDFTEKSDFYANQNFSSAKYLERLR